MAQATPTAVPPAFDATPIVAEATHLAQQFMAQAAKQFSAGSNSLEKSLQQAQSLQPIVQAFTDTAQAMAKNPEGLLNHQLQLHQTQLALGANFLSSMLGKTPAPLGIPAADDRRFVHPGWNTPLFDLLKQSYLLTSQWLLDGISQTDGVDDATRNKTLFYARQFVDAISPTNSFLTNPEAQATALATQGQSLLAGFKNLMTDLQRGKLAMTDATQFKVGENLATTPGQVVFRNRLIELIHYQPTTPKVHAKPLLICPPWINRFYILDLRPENSFVQYMLKQGFQVFMVSWKNPDSSYRDVGFDDYLTEGLFAALEATLSITKQPQVNAVGYCIGGTMLSTALAVMEEKKDTRIASATFFTTLTDFKQAGELGVFIDEQQVTAVEQSMAKTGYLDGKQMATTFSLLRANDLIWNFVVNNYLLGKQPFPFDILAWNDDSTRMPAAMHSWYLRNLYLKNCLAEAGRLSVLGVPMNLRTIKLPMYMVSAINDHITPWASCYAPYAKMASANKRFVLSKAGHVAGVVNPPTPAGKPVKRSFWVGEANQPNPNTWLTAAKETQDSWWPDYAAWLAPLSGEQVAAPTKLGNTTHTPLCPAPGTYVLE
jgi:polyhydroxyalkanoate synthase